MAIMGIQRSAKTSTTWVIEESPVKGGKVGKWEGTRRPGPGRGMTLIEVLVASVLLGIGVVGLISVATLAVRNQQKVAQRAAALYLAQETLAQIELVGPHVWMLGYPTQGSQEHERVVYEWTARIEPLAPGELFSVLVEVRWSGSGSGGAVALETWLNDYQAVTPTAGQEPDQAAPGAPGVPPGR